MKTHSARTILTEVLPPPSCHRTVVTLQQSICIFLGTALLIWSSKMKIPYGLVDISLQSTVVMILAFFIRPRNAFFSVLLYLFEGYMGVPVFQSSPEKGIGWAYMIGPSGGFLAGFVLASIFPYYILYNFKTKSFFTCFAAFLFSDLIIIQGCGFLYLCWLVGASPATALFFSFMGPTVCKALVAASLVCKSYKANLCYDESSTHQS